jgi:DNA-binding CsgD family transcriptional regulator
MVMCQSITVHAGGASGVGRAGGRLVQPEPLMQAAQWAGCPPVGRAEQGHGGRDEDAANQGGVHRDGDGQGQAEFLDAESLAGREAEEHDELYRPQHDRSVELATAGLGQSRFDAAFRRGRTMTIDEGVAVAVGIKLPSRAAPAARPPSHTLLTRRQLEIARLVADDLSNKQIATRLFLSERTVETHVTNILNKLGLNSRVQLGHWVAEATQE